MDARVANDRIAEKAEALHFRSRVPMVCECSSPDCRTIVMIGLEEYRAIRVNHDLFLVAPGHDARRLELLKEAQDYEVRQASRNRGNGDSDRRSA